MQHEGLSLEDGALMRSLVDFPGGLELHIGVRAPHRTAPHWPATLPAPPLTQLPTAPRECITAVACHSR